MTGQVFCQGTISCIVAWSVPRLVCLLCCFMAIDLIGCHRQGLLFHLHPRAPGVSKLAIPAPSQDLFCAALNNEFSM
jgi:hypothetical protein